MTKIVVLCDFDGTIVETDTAEFALANFATGDWRIFDEQLERGEITIEECMQKQFVLVRVSRRQILRAIERVTEFRLGFGEFVEHCKVRRIPLIVISAGLDFCIKHILRTRGLQSHLQIYCPKAKCTKNGIQFTFSEFLEKGAADFKESLVKYHKRRGKKVIYVGEGLSDYNAARSADFSFVIKGSKLAELCRREALPHKEICDFHEIIEGLGMDVKA